MLMVLLFAFGWSLAPVWAESEHSDVKGGPTREVQVVPAPAPHPQSKEAEKEDRVVPVPVPVPTPTPAPHHEDGNEVEGVGQSEGQGEVENGGQGEVENEGGGVGTSTQPMLAAQDFGVVNYDTGLGILKGYTAGFGLTNATFAGVQSVVVKLYSGETLLQTNTATPKVGATITGAQISSPFDVLGAFDYATDGYWTNVRGAEYGLHLVPDRVVMRVKLVDGKMLRAENRLLTGDPTIIVPAP